MSRVARKKSKSGIYHIMMRGINKQNIFEDDEDKQKFIDTIFYYKNISNYQIYSYCLMNNHIHLLMKETSEPISTAIKRISSKYVFWYNKKYERCGHLFQERFKSDTIESESKLLMVIRYIHQNPLKAGLSNDIKKYKWNSYNLYFEDQPYIDTKFVLKLFSDNPKVAMRLFKEYNNELNDDEFLDYNKNMRLTDDELKSYLAKYNITNIKKLDKSKRDDILRKLKAKNGISIRQISRVTGISKSLISRL